jgi:nucleoid DNA-binding protein
MAKVTIQEIAKVLVEKNGLSQRDASKFGTEMFALILERLQQGELVKVKGLGTFKIIDVEARESVSVRTGERVVIESHPKVSFTPDTTMKELVNKPFSQFDTVVLNDGVEFGDMDDDGKQSLRLSTETVDETLDEDTDEAPDETPDETEPADETVIDEAPAMEVEASAEVEHVTEKTTPSVVEFVVEEEIPSVVEFAAEEENEVGTVENGRDVVAVENERDVAVEEEETADEVEEEESPDLEESPKTVEEAPTEEFVFNDEEETGMSWKRGLVYAAAVLLLMGLSAYGGYYFGGKQLPTVVAAVDTVEIHDTVLVASIDAVPEHGTTETAEQSKSQTPEPAVATPAKTAKAEPAKPAEATETFDKYAAKDERVRLGAYRIVGLSHEVTVQPGQTFFSICRGNLGPDMACYVEVYNDLPRDPQIKVGQVIKIPKLEYKKRKSNKK